MTRKSLRRVCENAYMLTVCTLLMWNIPYMTEAAWTFPVRDALPYVGYGLAACGILLRREARGVILPLLFLGWMTAASVLAGRMVLDAQAEAIANGVTALLVILPAPQIVARERLMRWVRALLALWTAAMTLQALVGLWAMLTGHAVFSLRGTWYIGLNRGDHRLYLNAYVTTGAVKMGLSVLLAMLAAVMCRKRMSRVLYGLCAAAMLCCLALTDCRTAFIAVGAGLGALPLLWICRGRGAHPVLRRAGAIAAALAVLLVTYGALSGLVTALGPHIPRELDNITLTELPAHLLPEAAAEEAAVQHRAIEAGNVLNGRTAAWKGAFRLLRNWPRFLLTGTTAVRAAEYVNLYVDDGAGFTFAHVHSIYLHTLVAWGIPGLLLLAAFLLRFAGAARRVMLCHPGPVWMRLVPVPALYVLLCDAVDCFMLFQAFSPMLLFGCFFAGWTLVLDHQARGAVPEIPAGAAVDVVIPAYNAEKTLRRAVDSALACPCACVILVDDGSADGTAALCAQLARNGRVTVISQANAGASAARNTGLDAATAAYVTLLDADDVLLPGALERLMSAGCSAVQGRVVRRDPGAGKPARVQMMTGAEALDAALRNPTAHLHTHGWLFRREWMTERFDPSLTHGEDGEWLLRTLRCMPDAAFLDVPAYRYTLRPDSALRGGRDGVCAAYMATMDAAAPHLKTASPGAAALYRLSHLLLMLTHGHFDEAMQLRNSPLFAEAFRAAELTGMSPRIWTLRCLKWGWTPVVRLIIRIRRWMNRILQSQEEA